MGIANRKFMKIITLTTIALLHFAASSQAQTDTLAPVTDTSSSQTLQQAIIMAYGQHRRLSEVPAPVSYIGQAQLGRFSNNSILPALNSAPGVRMEERSPGSYRLNIRGSSLRSPFGVRDVKVYFNDIPLTDPGGNTYLNGLGYYEFGSLEIIKGPAGSLYGAGVGGAMLISSLQPSLPRGLGLDYSMGSYNTQGLHLSARLGDPDHQSNLSYSRLSSDGYRQQSAMRRDIASWENRWKVNSRQVIHGFLLYSDMYYQTPGGLTAAQYNANPKAARLQAVQNKAAIYQKTFLSGLSQDYSLSESWRNTTSLYGAYTDFTNPGIRAYEIRQEPHFGGRTVFMLKQSLGKASLQVDLGAEAQKGFFTTRDFNNRQGVPDSLQTDDKINNWQYMVFGQADLKWKDGWIVTLGGSLNKSAVEFTRLSTVPPALQKRSFENKLPPRLALLKKWGSLSVYGSVARGFSTPAVSELLRSDGLLGSQLQPEDGIDFELGARGSYLHDRLYFDASAFNYRLKNTIVQRIDSNGVYYYINAGATRQQGIESQLSYLIVDHPGVFFRQVKGWVSYTFDDFKYSDFKSPGKDSLGRPALTVLSGKFMPGVARQILVSGLDILTQPGFYAHITYTYTDKIFLNDANGSYAGSYNLLSARAGLKRILCHKWAMEIWGGADNILNIHYSLGNDINAAVGRYFNAAPGINYVAGLSLRHHAG